MYEKHTIVYENNRGFYLVEVLIVLAIIGLLLAIAVPSFLQARNTSRVREMGLEVVGRPNGNSVIYNGKTLEVVRMSDDFSKVLGAIGKIEDSYKFASLSNGDKKHAITDYPKMLPYDKDKANHVVISYKSYSDSANDPEVQERVQANIRLVKLAVKSPETAQEIVDRANKSVAVSTQSKTVTINRPEITTYPDRIILNGVVYTQVKEDQDSLQSSDSWKYIEKSFGE